MKSWFLGLKPSSIVLEWLESGKAVDVTSEKFGVRSKVQYFDFLVSCLYTLNPLSLSMKWVATLVATTYTNMESMQSAKLPTWIGWRGQRGDYLFLFLDWILFCAIHIMYMKLSWKFRNGKVPGNYVKSFRRILLCLLEASIVSYRNCIIRILGLIIVNYLI